MLRRLKRLLSGAHSRTASGRKSRHRSQTGRRDKSRHRDRRQKTLYLNLAYVAVLVLSAFLLAKLIAFIPPIDVVYTFWGWTTLVVIAAQLLVFIRFRRLRAGSTLIALLCIVTYFSPGLSDWRLNSGSDANATRVPIRLVTYNVDGANPRDLTPLVNYIQAADPDILMLSEAPWSLREKTAPLNEIFPYSSAWNGDTLILSKWPLNAENLTLAQSPRTQFHAIKAVVQAPGGAVTLFGVHAPTMSIASYAAERDRYFQSLGIVAAGDTGPRIMVGDFNATRWDPALASVLREGQFHSQAQWRYPLTRIVQPLPIELGARIDHVFASDGLGVEKCHVGPKFGSDHQLLACEIAY